MKLNATRILLVLAILCAAAALIAYTQSGITAFTTTLSSAAITAWAIGMLLCAAGFFLDIKAIKFPSYLALLFAVLKAAGVQGTYIVNVLVSIDGTSFSAGFIITVVAGLAAVILALIAALRKSEREVAAV